MEWEYRHLQVGIKDLINASLEDKIVQELNRLAEQGWQVDQVIRVHTETDKATTVLYLLKRKTLQGQAAYAASPRAL
jgi:hypothetical protein